MVLPVERAVAAATHFECSSARITVEVADIASSWDLRTGQAYSPRVPCRSRLAPRTAAGKPGGPSAAAPLVITVRTSAAHTVVTTKITGVAFNSFTTTNTQTDYSAIGTS